MTLEILYELRGGMLLSTFVTKYKKYSASIAEMINEGIIIIYPRKNPEKNWVKLNPELQQQLLKYSSYETLVIHWNYLKKQRQGVESVD